MVGGKEFRLVDGIHDAAVHGANVINVSLGMAAPGAVMAQAIDDAVGHGAVYRCRREYRQRGVHLSRQCPWGRHRQHLFCRWRRLVVLPSVRQAQAPPQVRMRSVP
jgi:hypothetical protein